MGARPLSQEWREVHRVLGPGGQPQAPRGSPFSRGLAGSPGGPPGGCGRLRSPPVRRIQVYVINEEMPGQGDKTVIH